MIGRLYDRLNAAVYDRFMRGAERVALRDRRRRLLAEATGDVLEIGAGTGANREFYDATWKSATLAEPSAAMRKKLRAKLDAFVGGRSNDGGVPQIRVLDCPAEHLPLEDGSVDTVVSTLVLCTVGDLDAALVELRRVLRVDGRLLFLEHVRSGTPRVARMQDRVNGVWRRVGNGCNCNRDTAAAIRRAGFEIESIETGEIPGAWSFVRPLIQGVAVKRADTN